MNVLSRATSKWWSLCLSIGILFLSCLTGNGQMPGAVDLSFEVALPLNGLDPAYFSVSEIVLLQDGRAYFGGNFLVKRIDITGAIDQSFTAQRAGNFALQLDGKIIWATGNGLGRMKSNGDQDLTFPYSEVNPAGIRSIIVQSDGKILFGGLFTNINKTLRRSIARLNPDGTVETNFTVGGGVNYSVNRLALQDDGKIIVGGEFASVGSLFRNNIARLNKDGSPDASFDSGWGTDDAVRCLAVQPDRKIVIGGSFTQVDLMPRSRIARLNPDGSLDASFQPGSGANNDVFSVAVQADGKILIAGSFTNVDGVDCKRVARLNTDGTLDKSFDTSDGPDGTVNALAVRPDGRVLIGGLFSKVTGVARTKIAQLNGNIELLVGPSILKPPLDGQVQTGQTISLSVLASGTPPPSFQWIKDGVPIAGANSSTFSIANAQLSDAGAYSVLMTNVAGKVTGGPVAIVVDGKPVITVQPSDIVGLSGTDVTFTASVAGPPPLTFQWYHDGQALSNGNRITGATNQTLHLAAVQGEDQGSYSVFLADQFGSVFSRTAKLVVVPQNDAFAFPVEIPQVGGQVFGDNRYATKQPGEPSHAGNTGGHSLWFAWTSLVAGRVVVDTEGSTFDTLLAIYTDSNLTTLTLINADDDGAGFAGASRLILNASANTRYLIATDGYDSENGFLQLNLFYEQPVLAAQLTAGSGPLQIELAAKDQSGVLVEASTDLKTWVPVNTNLQPRDGILRFTYDLNSASQNQRFFRAFTR